MIALLGAMPSLDRSPPEETLQKAITIQRMPAIVISRTVPGTALRNLGPSQGTPPLAPIGGAGGHVPDEPRYPSSCAAGAARGDTTQMGTTNEDFLNDPSMSREYKSWPALRDMDYAVHSSLVATVTCHFVQSTALPYGLRVQKAGLAARSGRGAKAQASPPMRSGCWSVWHEESMWGGGPNVQGPCRPAGEQNPSRVQK